MLLTSDEVDCLEYKLAELGNCKYFKINFKICAINIFSLETRSLQIAERVDIRNRFDNLFFLFFRCN